MPFSYLFGLSDVDIKGSRLMLLLFFFAGEGWSWRFGSDDRHGSFYFF